MPTTASTSLINSEFQTRIPCIYLSSNSKPILGIPIKRANREGSLRFEGAGCLLDPGTLTGKRVQIEKIDIMRVKQKGKVRVKLTHFFLTPRRYDSRIYWYNAASHLSVELCSVPEILTQKQFFYGLRYFLDNFYGLDKFLAEQFSYNFVADCKETFGTK